MTSAFCTMEEGMLTFCACAQSKDAMERLLTLAGEVHSRHTALHPAPAAPEPQVCRPTSLPPEQVGLNSLLGIYPCIGDMLAACMLGRNNGCMLWPACAQPSLYRCRMIRQHSRAMALRAIRTWQRWEMACRPPRRRCLGQGMVLSGHQSGRDQSLTSMQVGIFSMRCHSPEESHMEPIIAVDVHCTPRKARKPDKGPVKKGSFCWAIAGLKAPGSSLSCKKVIC